MKRALRVITALVLAYGIALTAMNGITYTRAELSGGGATVLTLHPAASSTIRQAMAIPSALGTHQPTNAADEFVMGILLILLGFFLHAFLVSYEHRSERNIPIKVIPRKKKSSAIYWMQVKV